MQYVRIYPGPDGESHFEDVDVPMQASPTAPGGRVGRSDPLGDALYFNSTVIDPATTPLGEWGAWHHAPRRQFIVWLAGELEIQVSDGEVRRFGPATVLLVEDTTGKGHRNRRLSPGGQNIFIPLVPAAPSP